MSNRGTPAVTATYAGVDWISASLGREEIDDQVWLYDAIHALEDIALQGNKYTRRSLMGFDGWECGGCFVGSNEKRHYAQFAGHYAQAAYHMLEHPKVNISRIDLQVTVQYSEELLKEGRKVYARAVNYNQELPEHRRRKINIWIGADGGDTVYIGSASSETRARIYNKDKQSKDSRYERSWRYEIVYRDKRALPVFRRIINASNAGTDVIIPEVVSYLAERGVTVRGLGAFRGNVIAPPKVAPSDVDRKLRWIRNQVVPTIRFLAEAGYAEDVMEAIAEAISAARNQT